MRKDELEDYVIEQRITEGVRKGLTKWVHIVCRTATSAVMVVVYWTGGMIYDHWERFAAAVDAFIKAGKQ